MFKQVMDIEELIMDRNPRGGRPQKIGATVHTALEPKNSLIEIDGALREDTSIRFMLGYCPCECGRKIVAGEKKALYMAYAILKKLYIESFDELKGKIKELLIPKAIPKRNVYWDDLG